MEPMTAYDLAKRITETRGWSCTSQTFDGQACTVVQEEQRWLGVTTSAVLLPAGTIRPDCTPTNPIAETSAQPTDLDGLLRELERLWQRLEEDGAKQL